jgi:hypothetical protein
MIFLYAYSFFDGELIFSCAIEFLIFPKIKEPFEACVAEQKNSDRKMRAK